MNIWQNIYLETCCVSRCCSLTKHTENHVCERIWSEKQWSRYITGYSTNLDLKLQNCTLTAVLIYSTVFTVFGCIEYEYVYVCIEYAVKTEKLQTWFE